MKPISRPKFPCRDLLAATLLFAATALTILWQNSRLCVLWDFSYVLDSSWRIAQGQVPYRDFPFVHPPMPFLIQAAILKLFGRVYWHHALYAALAGGLGTLLAWRIFLNSLRDRVAHAWGASVLLAAPLAMVGIYCILPHPSYDCDTAIAFLAAFYLLQRVGQGRTCGKLGCALAGAALALPAFFKQNMGLPPLAAGIFLLVALIGMSWWGKPRQEQPGKNWLAVLAGAVGTLAVGLLALHVWAGLGNYYQWTVRFAGQRRMPATAEMIAVFHQPWLLWMLPSVAAGLALARRRTRWAQLAAGALLATPFLWTLATPLVYSDPEDRAAALLALWPLVLVLSGVLALARLLRGQLEPALLPLLMLAAIAGTFMSQQLWGSTYAIWPLFLLLVAELIGFVGKWTSTSGRPSWLPLGVSAVISLTLLLCGGLYTASEERLGYIDFSGDSPLHSAFASLQGASAAGPYLADFDELLRYSEANIPPSDGVVLLPGEDPFYFATGRTPRFPVLLFDPATDPYSAEQLVRAARTRAIVWLIVKKRLQIKADVTPERAASLELLEKDFHRVAQLRAYDVYRR